MINEVYEYFVSRAKILDVIEPNLLRIKTIMDKMDDSPWNHHELKMQLIEEAGNLTRVWDKQNG